MDSRAHRDGVYRTRRPTEVSWYRPHLDVSLQLIEDAATDCDAHVIGVGGGESTRVDDLPTREFRNLPVLDISANAMDVVRARLGADADQIEWLCGNVRTFAFAPHHYDVWHPLCRSGPPSLCARRKKKLEP